MSINRKKLAIVYDWLDSTGGAERLLEHVAQTFPDADWYIAHGDQKHPLFKTLQPKTSFMQKLPFPIQKSRALCAPLYPFAFESFDFSQYETVFSITSSFAKGLITRPETKHISYIFTPTKFLWGERQHAFFSKLTGWLFLPFLSHLRRWDSVAAQRPDEIYTLSKFTQHEIKKIYNRDAKLLYPPFDSSYWESLLKSSNQPGQKLIKDVRKNDYYLVVSRLEPHKRVILAIQACNKLQKTLVIVGSGTSEKTLRNISGSTIHFLGNITDAQLAHIYKNAKALLMPQIEDFGYVSLEAQTCGCPVITFAQSGAVETIIPDETGFTFNAQTIDSLCKAIENFEALPYTVTQHMSSFNRKNIDIFDVRNFTHTLTHIL